MDVFGQFKKLIFLFLFGWWKWIRFQHVLHGKDRPIGRNQTILKHTFRICFMVLFLIDDVVVVLFFFFKECPALKLGTNDMVRRNILYSNRILTSSDKNQTHEWISHTVCWHVVIPHHGNKKKPAYHDLFPKMLFRQ